MRPRKYSLISYREKKDYLKIARNHEKNNKKLKQLQDVANKNNIRMNRVNENAEVSPNDAKKNTYRSNSRKLLKHG